VEEKGGGNDGRKAWVEDPGEIEGGKGGKKGARGKREEGQSCLIFRCVEGAETVAVKKRVHHD